MSVRFTEWTEYDQKPSDVVFLVISSVLVGKKCNWKLLGVCECFDYVMLWENPVLLFEFARGGVVFIIGNSGNLGYEMDNTANISEVSEMNIIISS